MKSIILNIIRWILAFIFIFAGIIKIFNINDFVEIIYQLVIIPDLFAPTFAYIIVLTEIAVGIALILKLYYNITLRASLYLIIIFSVIVTIKLVEGADVSCGCFGDFSDSKIDVFTLIRNFVLLTFNFILLVELKHTELLKNKSNYFNIIKNEFSHFIIVLLFFFLAFQNLTFLIQNVELKNRVETLTKRDTIAVGDTVNTVNLRTATNELIEYHFKNNFSLIYVLKAGCQPCEKNVEIWKELANIENENVKVIGISIDPIHTMNNYIQKNNIKYDIYSAHDENFLEIFKVYITPYTIILNKSKEVIFSYQGVLNENIVRQIKNQLNGGSS